MMFYHFRCCFVWLICCKIYCLIHFYCSIAAEISGICSGNIERKNWKLLKRLDEMITKEISTFPSKLFIFFVPPSLLYSNPPHMYDSLLKYSYTYRLSIPIDLKTQQNKTRTLFLPPTLSLFHSSSMENESVICLAYSVVHIVWTMSAWWFTFDYKKTVENIDNNKIIYCAIPTHSTKIFLWIYVRL